MHDKDGNTPIERPVYKLEVRLAKGIFNSRTGFWPDKGDEAFDFVNAQIIDPGSLEQLTDQIADELRLSFKQVLEEQGDGNG